MESFSIVALQLLPDCSKHIRKVLQEDWYFFTQKYHLDPDTKYPIRNPDYKLPDDFFDPKISISAIVGKNGCGKSTIVEIMLRVINNFAVNITAKAHKDCQLYPVSDVNAALYFEIDGKLNFIETSKVGILWGIIDTFGKRVHPNKIEKTTPLEKALQQLRQFFFTIVNNYSFHSYNVDDYGEESVGKDKIWINSLFHKNDGYLTPVVLNPFRREGRLDIRKETLLTNSRLAYLFYYFNTKQFGDFIDDYQYRSLSFSYNQSRVEEKYTYNLVRNKKTYDTKLVKRVSVKKKERDYFNITLKAYLGENIRSGIPSLNGAYKYLVAKTYHIVATYPNYTGQKYVAVKDLSEYCFQEEESRIKDLVRKLLSDFSHVTFKIRQTLKYIDYVTHNVNATDGRDFQNLTEDYIKYEPKNLQILEGLNTIHKEQVSMPPSFFDIRIELSKSDGAVIYFDKMSSGERQFLFYMSTILYHVRNLDSVVDDVESVHYNYVNIVLEEVELYFHPEYQRQFIDKLINYLKKSQFNRIKHFNIIVVTHSPFILSDIPQDNVLFLRDGKNDNEVCDFKTFGANIHDLLRTSFFLENGLVGEFANNKIEELLTLLQGDNNSKKQWYTADVQYIINTVGEDLIREALQELYDILYQDRVTRRNELERQMKEIERQLSLLDL